MKLIEDPQFLRKIVLGLNTRFTQDEWTAQDDLYELRIVDSYAIIQLVVALEDALHIVFDYDDLHYKNFKTLTDLCTLLNSKYQCRLCQQD